MEIKKLDELQKLNVVENEKGDVDLCWITCGISCTNTEVKDKPVELEERIEQ